MRTQRMMHPFVLANSLLIVALLSGCASTPASPYEAEQDPIADSGYPAVTVEKTLRDGLVVDYERIVFQGPSATTPAQVQVPVRSNTRFTVNVQYQFSWFDESGLHVRDSGWKFVAMPPGQERFFRSNAIDDRSSSYRLEIRSAR